MKQLAKLLLCALLWPVAVNNASATFAATKRVAPKPRPTLIKVKYARVRLSLGKKSAVIDLDSTDGVTLGGESGHRYRVFFATVKADKVFYLFQVQSGPALSDPNGPCGGDAPQTLVWLQTDLNLQVEAANSEVFASCAYNGGRYQVGKTRLTANSLKIVFEQQRKQSVIEYDPTQPEKGFEVKEL